LPLPLVVRRSLVELQPSTNASNPSAMRCIGES
jgi:hypothetical protein